VDIATLASLAGRALVASAVTEAWGDVRQKVARLFGRWNPGQQTAPKLDGTHAQLAAAAAGDLDHLQAELGLEWAVRFKDLLADHPEAETDLLALARQIPATALADVDHIAAAGRDMGAWAARGSVAANVIHGDVTAGPTRPGPVSS